MCFFLAETTLFCAAQFNTVIPPSSPLILNQITCQRGRSYNLATGYFVTPMNGTYIFHLSSGLNTAVRLRIYIRHSSNKCFSYLMSGDTGNNGFITTSLALFQPMTQGMNINLELGDASATSDSMRQTSWSIFLLDNLMYPLIMFCAGISTIPTSPTKLFDIESVNLGGAWNLMTNKFTAPLNGVYVFSLNCVAYFGQGFELEVVVNNDVRYGLFYDSTINEYYDITSRTFAVMLTAGDTVFVHLMYGNFRSDGFMTSFMGFLYEPMDGCKVIWSVHRTSGISGEYNILSFDTISANVGGGWNALSNTFVVPYAGIYQLHLSSTSSAACQNFFNLIWNGAVYAGIKISTTTHNGIITRSRSITVEASIGDTFNIATPFAANLHSNSYKLISFTGYFLSV